MVSASTSSLRATKVPNPFTKASPSKKTKPTEISDRLLSYVTFLFSKKQIIAKIFGSLEKTFYICSRNPPLYANYLGQAPFEGLYLNLKLWKRKRLLFMWMAIIFIMAYAKELRNGRRFIGSML